MRNKYILLTLVMILVAVLFFLTSASLITTNLKKIEQIDRVIRREQERLNSAKVLNDELKEVSIVIENSLTDNRELKTEEANEFARELAELANNYSIAVHSLYPKVSFAQGRTLEQQFSMELEATYVQMGQLLASLERYDYILKINNLEVRPQSEKFRQTESGEREVLYKVLLELSIFKIVKEA